MDHPRAREQAVDPRLGLGGDRPQPADRVGEVVAGATVRQGAVTADGGGEIVAGIAMMLKGENSRSVVERVKARVVEIRKTLPKGVELIPFYDRTELIDRTIRTVAKNLIEGAIFVIVVLILLLGNWRGAFWQV